MLVPGISPMVTFALALSRGRFALAALAVALVVVRRGARLGGARVSGPAFRDRLHGRFAGPGERGCF